MVLDASLIKRSWRWSSERAPDLVERFYGELAWKYPSARRALERVLGRNGRATERLAFLSAALIEHIDDRRWVDLMMAMLADGHGGVMSRPTSSSGFRFVEEETSGTIRGVGHEFGIERHDARTIHEARARPSHERDNEGAPDGSDQGDPKGRLFFRLGDDLVTSPVVPANELAARFERKDLTQ